MAKIFIESKSVAGTNFKHSYLVYQDDAGNETVIRGGPQSDNPFDFGEIDVKIDQPLESSRDARGNDSPAERGQVELDLSGRNAAEVWQTLKTVAGQIQGSTTDYDMFGTNCNAVTRTLLDAAGIPPTLPNNGGNYPGWDLNLPTYDTDGDGIPNTIDKDPFGPDTDADGIPDFKDLDDDGDYIPDDYDLNPRGPGDLDGDGIPDDKDPDKDGDGIPNGVDPTPNGDAPPPPPPQTPPPAPGSPLILDLDGDGVETSGLAAGIYFDHGGDGLRELTGFAAADDGLLALDLDGDGKITRGAELFGDQTLLADGSKARNGFQALARLDSNADGKVDSADSAFSSLRVWRDLNQNGVSDEGELYSLSQLGIQSLALKYTEQTQADAFGNEHRQVGSFTKDNGQQATMTDVWFVRNPSLVKEDLLEVSAAIAQLPDAAGFGKVHSLHQAMVRDASGELQSLVGEFVGAQSRQQRQAVLEKLIFKWTGQTGEYRNYYQSIIDARRIGALEAFYGDAIDLPRGSGQEYAAIFNGLFRDLVDTVFYQLASSTHLQPLFNQIGWVKDNGTGAWLGDFSRIIDDLVGVVQSDPARGQETLLDFIQAVRGVNTGSGRNLELLRGALHGFIQGNDLTVYSSSAVAAVVATLTQGATSLTYRYGTSGDDTLSLGESNDLVHGGRGNDTLAGGRGSDVYLFNLGDGQDRISDDNEYQSNNIVDTLRLGSGIFARDISVSRVGKDLLLSHSNGQDSITISNWFAQNSGRYQLERIEFADGQVWKSADLSAQVLRFLGGSGDDVYTGVSADFSQILSGGAGNDILTAGAGEDLLRGGIGNDVLNGGAGADIYIYNLGDGQDVIADDNFGNGNDKVDILRFGNSIAPADLAVSRSGLDLLLSHSNGVDRITVKNWFASNSGRYQLERIEFADNSVWTSAELNARLLQQLGGEGDDIITGVSADFVQSLNGGAGNDTLTSGGGADRLEGGVGNDTLYGGSGSDLYLFNLGDGRDVLRDDSSFNGSDIDVLRFGAGISADDIIVTRSGNHVLLSHRNGQDSVMIKDWFAAADGRYRLERIEFTDGTLWTSAMVSAPLLVQNGTEGDDVLTGPGTGNQIINGLAGNDTLTASGGNDQLTGGTGNDVLYGGSGSDLYLFNLGDGQDVLRDDSSYSSGNIDVLRFGAGIGPQDITVTRSGNHVIFSHGNGQDRISVQDWFSTLDDRYKLERIEFADGTVWSSSMISTALLVISGSEADDVLVGPSTGNQTLNGLAGNDTLTASGGNDQLSGGTGNDRLYGGSGSDLYLFNLGDGQDVLRDDSSFASGNIDVLRFGQGISADDITISRSGNHVILSHRNGQDQVTVQDWFTSSDDRYKLERIEFADGSQWTSAYVTELSLAMNGTADDDVLAGPSTGNQTIRGLAGNDRLTAGSGNDLLEGGLGNDTLDAGAGNDQLNGGSGNDVLYGGSGSDLYLFNLGDGQDVLRDDSSFASGNIDVLRFGQGIGADDITISRSGNHVVFSHRNGQDRITVQDWFTTSDDRYKLEWIEFADGSRWASAYVTELSLAMNGTVNDDVLTGPSTGNQTLRGLAGNDSLTTGAGNDLLEGGLGNDTLTAGAGNDQLNGGTGNDVLYGGAGSDLYLFNLGDGQDVLRDDSSFNSDNIDVLRFGEGIGADDISITRAGNHVVLSHRNGRDQITVQDWFTSADSRYRLERIEFADGTVWTSAMVSAPLLLMTGDASDNLISGPSTGNQTLIGLAGNDTLTASGGADTLNGGTGNDKLYGGSGSDLYLFNLGDGQDLLRDDSSFNADNIDVLRFGEGIGADDITITRSGNHVILSHRNGRDQITVQDWFTSVDGRYRLERIEFADGTVWTSAMISAPLLVLSGEEGDDVLTGPSTGNQVLSGLAGNDTLTASGGNDQLSGGTGNDTLYGGSGSDLYLFNLGDGQDILRDDSSYASGNIDVLRFGAGISANDISIGRSGNHVILSHRNGQDRITVQDWFSTGDDRHKLERIEFADGTVWSSALISTSLLVITGTAGDDVLVGPSTGNQTLSGLAGNDTLTASGGNDQLSGGAGNDTLYGGSGSDLYLFNLGDGQDVLRDDSSFASGNIDVLRLGQGISADDISISRAGNHVILSHSNGQDRITVQDWFTSSDDRYKLERIEFADGTRWDSAYVTELSLAMNGTANDDVLTGPSTGNQTIRGLAGNDSLTSGSGNDVLDGGLGNDTLTAGAGNDRLVGGAGNDKLYGGTGSDLYLFNLGDGQDVLRDDTSFASGNIDVLRFGEGIAAQDIVTSRSGNHVIFSHRNGQEQVTVQDWFTATDDRYKLERIEFADGTVWTSAMVSAPLLVTTGTEGNDVLLGASTGNQTLSGLGGDDSLTSGADNDVLDGGLGNDTLTAGAGNDRLVGGAGNDKLFGGTGSDLYLFNLGDGQDVLRDDTSFASGNSDVLRFGEGIAAQDILTSRSGNHVIFSHRNGQEQVTVQDWFTATDDRYKLERIEFADGTVWTSAMVSAPLLVTTGTEGNDVLVGASTGNQTLSGLGGDDSLTSGADNDVLDGGLGNDTLTAGAGNDRLVGGAGNDKLYGGTGSDLYLFNLGDGQDVLRDDTSFASGNSDVLRFGEGIAAQDIVTSRSGNHVIFSHRNGQEQVTVQDWFTATDDRYKLERIEFADGTVWTSAMVSAPLLVTTGTEGNDVLLGASTGNQTLSGLGGDDSLTSGADNDVLDGGLGNDTLTAGAGNDRLVGGAGNDKLYGGTGSDLYLFNLGDGQDVLRDDTSFASGNIDVLRFGEGIAAQDILTSRSGNHVIFSHRNGQEQVTVQDWFTTTDDRYKLERIEFADGTQWTSAMVANFAVAPAGLRSSAAPGDALLDQQVHGLVAAMAAFAPEGGGFSLAAQDRPADLFVTVAVNGQ
ncbi:calcium-binding protein [Pseudomonas tructae]|nr:calcium-binding protein [Pseudomonas tructae]